MDAETERYFETIRADIKKAYVLAEKARAQNKDPEPKVDITVAEDLAARCEGLISVVFSQLIGSGTKERIRELEKQYGKNDERVALKIAEETAKQEYCRFESEEQAIEAGIRVGVAYLTLAVVTAPLEGIVSVTLRGTTREKYLALSFAGPIRSAGGTASAMTVVLADYVRRKMGLAPFVPTKDELERYATESEDYERFEGTQYAPTRDEIRLIIKNTPVCLDGDPTMKLEVSNYKDIPRVETNFIRGGLCLTMAMMCLKAPKMLKRIKKLGKEFDLEEWFWLEEYIMLQKKKHSAKKKQTDEKYTPNTKYIEKVIAGRPVLSHPARAGGLRLRYGRPRTGGMTTTAVHPALPYIMNEFIAIGTQLATELPGKGTTCTVSDSIEPPVVRLANGDVIEVRSSEEAKKIFSKIDSILSLGDILIPFGEFVFNAHRLLPAAYCEEWWAQEAERALDGRKTGIDLTEYIKKPFPAPQFKEAYQISKELGIPLHPRYNFFWHDISREQLAELVDALASGAFSEDVKKTLEVLCIPHKKTEKGIDFGELKEPVFAVLGNPARQNTDELKEKIKQAKNTTEAVSALAGVKIMERGPTRVGLKMGRPEKADKRLMVGRPQALFPCGREGGRMRNLIEAYSKGHVTADIASFYCSRCKKIMHFPSCPECGEKTEARWYCSQCGKTELDSPCCSYAVCHKEERIRIKEHLDRARTNLGFSAFPKLFKSVRGMACKNKNVEFLEKGLLRTKYDLYTFKDGTIRYDSTNLPLTHFKPKEVNVPVDKLREFGYTTDYKGEELRTPEQILELKVQDIILSDNRFSSGAEYLVNVAKFVDELLVNFYGLEPYYNVKTRQDLVGKHVVGLAPHTSAGIVGRIIGFTPARVCYAHPFWHAAKRRDADGDEDSVILLMDALLNFSRQFLPDTRGGRTMDAPLVLTILLDPEEIDDEAWNVDTEETYPLEFYEDTLEYRYPWKIRKKITTVENLIGKPEIFHLKFTHDTEDINDAPYQTQYVMIEAMIDKVMAQLELARKIRAVDENNVAELIIEHHFLRDIKGNLRTFSRQKVRCVACNAKYRRPPLLGKCTSCGGKLVLTVHEGTIRKYIEPTKRIMESYRVAPYVLQEFSILEKRIDSMFGKKARQLGLGKFS